MGDQVESFPLFPLGVVLLPGELLQLHIFEERYKLMVGQCLDRDSEFGVVWLSDEQLHEVGCTARVTQVLDRFEDGRMNIVVTGGRPFRLDRRVDDMPYPAGDVELTDLDRSSGDPELAAEAHESYADLVELVTDERPDGDALDSLDAFEMAGTIEFELSEKQRLLETATEDERLRMVATLFRTTVDGLDETERLSELAKSNGHLRH